MRISDIVLTLITNVHSRSIQRHGNASFRSIIHVTDIGQQRHLRRIVTPIKWTTVGILLSSGGRKWNICWQSSVQNIFKLKCIWLITLPLRSARLRSEHCLYFWTKKTAHHTFSHLHSHCHEKFTPITDKSFAGGSKAVVCCLYRWIQKRVSICCKKRSVRSMKAVKKECRLECTASHRSTAQHSMFSIFGNCQNNIKSFEISLYVNVFLYTVLTVCSKFFVKMWKEAHERIFKRFYEFQNFAALGRCETRSWGSYRALVFLLVYMPFESSQFFFISITFVSFWLLKSDPAWFWRAIL